MYRARITRHRMKGATAVLAPLVIALASTGCQSSAPEPASKGRLLPSTVVAINDSLPDVAVSVKRDARSTPGLSRTDDQSVATSADPAAPAWYVTTVKDPVRGIYTAAVERRNLNHLAPDGRSDETPRALLALVLFNGRPSDIVLSLETGQFECAGHDRNNVCPLPVSVDGAPRIAVRFSAPRHGAATHLHLAGGADARRLLAAIGRAKHLLIQPTFKDEKPADLDFALSGLAPAIATVVKHSVAANQKLAAQTPGA